MSTPPSGTNDRAEPSAELHLLRTARLLYSAAATAEAVSASGRLEDRLIEADVKAVLWQAVSLLPPGLVLDDATEPTTLAELLQKAGQELRRLPIDSYPAGTPTVRSDLTQLLARLADVTGGARP